MKFEPKKLLKKLELQEFPQPDIIRLKYPLVLCHGYGGIAGLIKPSPLHDPCMFLRKHSVIAFAPNIVPYAKIETRAEQWVDKIDQLQKKYGFGKFNIVAHSMAGLDMRYALSHMDLAPSVASLTTLATPHQGTSLAELVLKTPETLREKLGVLFDWFGESLYPGSKSDAVAAVHQLTREYVQEEFNPATPDHSDVTYYSYGAAVGKGTKEPLNTIYKYQNGYIFDHEGKNDAFVSEESAKWGEHMGTAGISHLEQIMFQVGKERQIKAEKFWKGLAENLADKGW